MKKLLTFLTLLTLFFTTAGAATVTVNIANPDTYTAVKEGTSGSGGEMILTNGDITIASNKGYLSTTDNHVRIYSGGILSVSTSSGTITRVEILSTASGTSNYGPAKLSLPNGAVGSYSYSGKLGTWTYADGANSVTFNATAQFRFMEVVVTYEPSSGPSTYSVAIGNFTGGSVTADKTSSINAGETVTLTIDADDDYELGSISAYKTGDESTTVQLNGTGNTRTFSMPAYNVTVNATFNFTGEEYELVTDASVLKNGDKLIISSVNSGSGYAMSTTQNNNNRGRTPIVVNDSKIAPTATTQIVTLETATDATDKWYLKVGDGYLYAPNGSDNYLRTGTTKDATYQSTISVNGAATIQLGSKEIRYNSSSSIFSCYSSTSTQAVVYLFRLAAAEKAYGITCTQPDEGGTILSDPSGPKSADAGELVTITANPSTGYELSSVTVTPTNDDVEAPTATINGNTATFTMPASDVTITATFSKAWYVIGTVNTPTEAASAGNAIWLKTGFDSSSGVAKSQMGTPVNIKVHTVNGWQIDNVSVTYTKANGSTATFTPTQGETNEVDQNGNYDGYGTWYNFTMPASDIIITATFRPYQPDLYLMGNAQDQNWEQKYKMNYNSSNTGREYSIRTYYAADHGEIQFEADSHRYGSGMNTNPYYVLIGEDGDYAYSEEVPLYSDNDKNFLLAPGIYDIFVNKDLNKVIVTPVELTAAFNPNGGNVNINQSAVLTSNLTEKLQEINSEKSATLAISTDGETFTEGSAYTFQEAGTITVYGKASYGYINVPASAQFTVSEVVGDEYELVTQGTDLIDGAEYVILNHANPSVEGHAMSTTQNTNNRGETALIPIVNNKVIPTEDTQIVTLEAATDGWNLKVGENNYLYAISGNNYLRTGNNNSNNNDYLAHITINENSHVATIEFQTDTKRYLRRNNSSSIFSCYKIDGGMQDVYLYKKSNTTPTVAMPTFNPVAGTYNAAQSVTISCTTTDATIYYSTNGTDFQEYTEAITVSESTTLYAKATKDGVTSQVATAEYIIDIPFIGEGDYVKIISTDDLTDGEYLIVKENSGESRIYGYVFDGSLSELDVEGNNLDDDGLGIDIVNYTIASSDEIDAATFTITATDDAYTIKSKSGYYIGNTGTSNTLMSSQETVYTNTIDFDGQGNVVIKGEGGTYLRYNSDSGQDRFRYYGSGQSPIALYKKVENPVDEPTSVTLAELCATGVTTEGENWYVISDMLKAVYADDVRGLLWCKDLGNQSIDPTSIHEGEQIDFLYNDAQAQNKRDWDQSNWIVLEFTTPDQGNNIGLMLTNAQDKLIKPGTIKGKLINDKNYTLKMDLDMIETLTPADEGYSEEPYEENVYCPSNFLPENLNIWGSIENGDGAYTGQNPQNFFFMNPKVQEVCYITYAEWNEAYSCFTVPTSSGFSGAFQVGWAYRATQTPPTLHDGNVYHFHAVVQRTDKEHYGPKNLINTKDGAPTYEYISVYPVDLMGDSNIITAINTVETGNGEVKSVKYVNVAGMVSDVPFQGVNIVVTEYTDGSRTTSKMLKK